MIFFELLISTILWYYYNFNCGFTTYILLKTLFNGNYKTSLFLLLNLFIYWSIGYSYLIFFKFYLLAIIAIFLHDKIMMFLEINIQNIFNFQKYNLYFSKINIFYNFVSILFSLPFYVLLENINYLFDFSKIKKIILDNKYYKIINNKYDLINNNYYDLPNISELENYNDDELDNILTNMLNPNNFMNMVNNKRQDMGKNKLNQKEIQNKLQDMGPLFNMFGNSFGDLNNMIKQLENTHKMSKNT